MLLAASAMALGIFSCSKSGSADLKDGADSVSFAVGFGNATELVNAIQGAKAQGEKVDSALFFKGFEEGFNSDTTKLWYYVRTDAGRPGCYALQGRLYAEEGCLHGWL